MNREKKYRIIYDQVFIPSEDICNNTVGSMSIFIKYYIYDRKTGEEILFESDDLKDQNIKGTNFYADNFITCSFDKEKIINIDVNCSSVSLLEALSKFTWKFEIVKYTKDIKKDDLTLSAVEITKEEFYKIMKENLELFDNPDNYPTQSISYDVEVIL